MQALLTVGKKMRNGNSFCFCGLEADSGAVVTYVNKTYPLCKRCFQKLGLIKKGKNKRFSGYSKHQAEIGGFLQSGHS